MGGGPRGPGGSGLGGSSGRDAPGGSNLLPSVSLPTGGGAIRGIGEKVAANPATGTISMSLPLPTPAGREGFSIELALGYDSGAGNGPFGIGWHLTSPSVARKTSKGLPSYRDDEDVFLLSGADDLVPARVGSGQDAPLDCLDRGDFRVQRYRPRVESRFDRIERWIRRADGDAHWRVVTRANVSHIYGRSPGARIADPDDPARVFSWLLEETHDDRGNLARYEYKGEDGVGVDGTRCSEASRWAANAAGPPVSCATAQRYLKRIHYGNRRPGVAGDWMFQVVFDHGEHAGEPPTPDEIRPWSCRLDAFSTYHPRFDLRTYRLCHRILVFHCFPELGASPRLVRSVDLTYDESPFVTYLTSVTQVGYRLGAGGWQRAALPPLELEYGRAELHDELRFVDAESLEGLPTGGVGPWYTWVDLDGEGLPGALSATAAAWSYKANLGGGRLAPPRRLPSQPAQADPAAGLHRLMDLGGDGQLDLVQFSRPLPGRYGRTPEGGWESFAPFEASPNIDWRDRTLRFLDLDGDGLADALLARDDAFVWYRSLGDKGFAPAAQVPKAGDESRGPRVLFTGAAESIHLADMSGDGLVDLVRVKNGEVCYWPNLGHGHFGRKVVMDRPPVLATPDELDPRRIRFADLDGSGTSDLLYLGRDGVCFWLNEAGNGWSERRTISSLPATAPPDEIAAVDLLGRGTACLVWSSPAPGRAGQPLAYVDLMGGIKPHLLNAIRNNLGSETRIAYAPSTRFYLDDKAQGRPWLTRLPFPVHVVERIEHYDGVIRVRHVTRYRYHHGYYDGRGRMFRGFAFVEQWDAESFGGGRGGGLFPEAIDDLDDSLRLPPTHTKMWFHTGAWLERETLERGLAREYWAGDPDAPLLPDTVLPSGLSEREAQEAARALCGSLLRQEVFADDGSAEAARPYVVSERSHRVRRLQSAVGGARAVLWAHPHETIDLHYERRPADPRTQHELVLRTDDWGNVTLRAKVTYPRRIPEQPEQARGWITCSEIRVANRVDDPEVYRVGVPVEASDWDLRGLPLSSSRPISAGVLAEAIAVAAELPYEAQGDDATPTRRLVERTRSAYYRDDLGGPLPLGEIGVRALLFETRTMALTPGLVDDVYGDRLGRRALEEECGYRSEDGAWFIPSSRQVFDPERFFLPVRVVDPFGNVHQIGYDDHALLVRELRDPVGNVTRVDGDYAALAPCLVTDANGNRTAAAFDPLGRVAAMAVMGKEGQGEGDTLADPTTRHEYDLDGWRRFGRPASARTLARERHGPANPRWQESRTYSDGAGREVMRKVQAEPGLAPARGPDGALARGPDGGLVLQPTAARWVGTGRKVLDNKGNAVKQYEPFFSSTPEYEDERDLVEWGVTPVIRHDPLGRAIRTELPDGTVTRVVFDAWRQERWDGNDGVEGTRWLAERTGLPAEDPRGRSAALAREHAGTPEVSHLDSLGRPFLTVADNGPGGKLDTRIELDIEGNQRSVTDARGVRVLAQRFDMLGRVVRAASADAGDTRMLTDALGRPARTWGARGQAHRWRRDPLGRPTHLFVKPPDLPEFLAELTIYGEGHPEAGARNLRGEWFQRYDGAGLVANERFDFERHAVATTRRLGRTYETRVDWSPIGALAGPSELDAAARPLLEDETFSFAASYDALGRLVTRTTPDGSETRLAYNESNLTETVDVRLRGETRWTPFVAGVDYNARGQRERVEHGNGVVSTFDYDPLTFRAARRQATRADGTRLQDLRYTYDPVGNPVEIRDGAQATVVFDGEVVPADGRYRYDATYRLVEAEGREHPGQQPGHADTPLARLLHPHDGRALRRYLERYAYDAVGNMERVSHVAGEERWTRDYAYAADSNRLLRTGSGARMEETYDHDSAGNMTRMPHLAELRYDHDECLWSVDLKGGGRAYYGYDGDGRRARKVVIRNGGQSEERIDLDGFEVYRRSRGGRTVFARETLHVLLGERRIALVETTTADTGRPRLPARPRVRYQLADHLDSSTLELDGEGQVITYEEYHPFGTTAYHAAANGPGRDAEVSAKRYRYTGKERDEETGLYDHGARRYAAWLCRWTQPDPAGLADGTNRYAYVRNNPLRFTDPSGTARRDMLFLEHLVRGLSHYLEHPEQATFEKLYPPGREVSARDAWRGILKAASAGLREGPEKGPRVSSALFHYVFHEIGFGPLEDKRIALWTGANAGLYLEAGRGLGTRLETTALGKIFGSAKEGKVRLLSTKRDGEEEKKWADPRAWPRALRSLWLELSEYFVMTHIEKFGHEDRHSPFRVVHAYIGQTSTIDADIHKEKVIRKEIRLLRRAGFRIRYHAIARNPFTGNLVDLFPMGTRTLGRATAALRRPFPR